MYTTNQAIELLSKKKSGLTLILTSNPTIHIFKTTRGEICRVEYGKEGIVKFNPKKYKDGVWRIDFLSSKFID